MPRNPNKIDYTGGLPKGFECFQELKDTRRGGNTKHHFGEIIFIAVAAIVCGMKSYDLIEEFGDIHEEWFRKWLQLPNGIPSYITFARVLESIDPEEFSACITAHVQLTMGGLPKGQIAVDGKALRGSGSEAHSHLHAVSAWVCGQGLTLGQAFVDEKSNEITAIPELLKLLNIKDCVVTIDAMGTQKTIASQIVEQGADYILSVKGNQGGLEKEISDYFHYCAKDSESKPLSADTWDKSFLEEQNRGRKEIRKTIICSDISWMNLDLKEAWEGINAIIVVQRQVLKKSGELTEETHYYITSLKGITAEQAHRYIRSHWEIENACHWTLDTLFREDHNQTSARNAAKNLGSLRRIALNALKLAEDHSPRNRKKASSLVRKQARAAQSDSYREHILSLV